MRDGLMRPNQALGQIAAEVCPYEALRIMALRAGRRPQVDRVAFLVEQVAVGSGWRVTARATARHEEPWPRLGGADMTTAAVVLDALETEVKDDVGALELSGHSILVPRSAEWRRVGCLEFLDALCVEDATPDRALFAMRVGLARTLEERVRANMRRLHDAGRPFDLAGGWSTPRPPADVQEMLPLGFGGEDASARRPR